MKYLFFILTLFATVTAQGQCSEFENLLEKGDTYLKSRKPNYQEAINAYTAAILACSDRAGEAKQRISSMVNGINKLKENAVAAEKKASDALIQVEKEKAATEEERKKAEENFRVAQQATRDAQVERDNAQTALANLEKANASTAALLLENADRDILNLHYEDALQKIKAAASLGALKPEVAKSYLEIAFWHGETGNITRAANLLDSISDFTKNTALSKVLLKTMPVDTAPAKNFLRAALKLVDPDHFKFLFEQKYYPDMVFVQGGKFMMGCDPKIDPNYTSNAILHEQELSSFHIARTETTVWQFALYCAAEGIDIKNEILESNWSDPGNNPVVNVQWFDAVEYAYWVSKQKGENVAISKEYAVALRSGYRLPTEAEWEYAAKGGDRPDNTIYSGGNDLDDVGWYDESRTGRRTQAVGKKKANALGLYDMSGNVWEWCQDLYELGGSHRVLRGGSWISNAEFCRTASRDSRAPDFRFNFLGFRLVFVP
jgi:formylglycine-generating enzyme required for sulfatase activity